MELTNVNIFLEAKTPIELVEKQILNNQVNGARFNYQTPIFTGKGWVIWFFVDIGNWINPDDLDPTALKLAKGQL